VLAMNMPLTGVEGALYNTIAIGVALMFESAIGLPPALVDSAKSGSAPPVRRNAHKVATPSKATNKVIVSKVVPAGRERWLRWAYVGAALLLVAYHGGTRAAESRAERSVEMRLCKRLREGLDATTPRMSRLLTKFTESRRATAAVTADAETILSAWTFAVEHWQQALAQKRSQVSVNNMSVADPETTRQVVAQALGRTEVPEDMADTDVVAEVYNLMGLNRLLITDESKPFFVTAVRSHREQRARTLEAWEVIKRLVYESEDSVENAAAEDGGATGQRQEASKRVPVELGAALATAARGDAIIIDGVAPLMQQPSQVYQAVNRSLAEYDLPAYMTDEAVLAELFTLLELPRDAVSFAAERLLLDAIRAHRADRAATVARSLGELLSKVVAVVRNDTSALDLNGSPQLQGHETWSLAAINQTFQALLPDVLALMEASPNETDAAAYSRFLDLANLTHDEAAATLPHVTYEPKGGHDALSSSTASKPSAEGVGESLLHASFVEARVRRAAEARAQSTFEELIATVRAEDPTLAAEDAAKAESGARYELKRERWLKQLLQRAVEADVTEATVLLQRAEEDGTEALAHHAVDAATAGTITATEGARSLLPDGIAVDYNSASVTAWGGEWQVLRAKRQNRSLEVSTTAERQEAKKHEHYARLLKLPRLIDEVLATWIDPADDLSDKQIFQELLRMMGLPETVELRLMRAMIEAVKQHRLRREREEMERGDWADLGAESVALRTSWRTAHPVTLQTAEALVNVGGEGNDFALFLAAMLQAIGARVRLSVGCSRNVTLAMQNSGTQPPKDASGQLPADAVQVCQLFAEVRLGRNPTKIGAWVRAWLPHSKWLGRRYHYRLDRDGYAWLNLDWVDGGRLQRPGVPYKHFDTLVTYHPVSLIWEVDGEELDSAGMPRPRKAVVDSLRIGVR